MSCLNCLDVIARECEDITVSLGLETDTEYTLQLIDRHGKYYRLAILTDAEGDFVIIHDHEEFPVGLFNSVSPPVNMQIFDADEVRMLFATGATVYSCFNLIFSAGTAPVTVPDPALQVAPAA
jgi:hypothetical protein